MFHLRLKSAIILLFAAAGFIAPFLEISFGDDDLRITLKCLMPPSLLITGFNTTQMLIPSFKQNFVYFQ